MNKPCKAAAVLLIIFTFFAFSSYIAGAAPPAELPAGLIIVDSDGMSAGSDGSYFLKASELRPGDLLEKRVTIQNLRPDKAFVLTMQTEPTSNEGNIDLFEEVEITVSLAGRQIYKGSANGEGTVDFTKPRSLGTFYPNQTETMALTVNFTTENREMLTGGDYGRVTFNFIFTARVDENYIPPKTGFDTNALMYIIIGVLCTACFVFLIILKVREKAAKKDVAI